MRILFAAVLVFTPSTNWHSAHARLSLTYPTAWHLTTRSWTNISNPVQRFVLSSGRVPPKMGQPRSGQVIGLLMEEKQLRPRDLREFPDRPNRFRVPRLTALEGFRGRWAEITFREHGRAFYLFIGAGNHAKRRLPTLLRAFDSLRVGT